MKMKKKRKEKEKAHKKRPSRSASPYNLCGTLHDLLLSSQTNVEHLQRPLPLPFLASSRLVPPPSTYSLLALPTFQILLEPPPRYAISQKFAGEESCNGHGNQSGWRWVLSLAWSSSSLLPPLPSHFADFFVVMTTTPRLFQRLDTQATPSKP